MQLGDLKMEHAELVRGCEEEVMKKLGHLRHTLDGTGRCGFRQKHAVRFT